jgi:hypothetical protein
MSYRFDEFVGNVKFVIFYLSLKNKMKVIFIPYNTILYGMVSVGISKERMLN